MMNTILVVLYSSLLLFKHSFVTSLGCCNRIVSLASRGIAWNAPYIKLGDDPMQPLRRRRLRFQRVALNVQDPVPPTIRALKIAADGAASRPLALRGEQRLRSFRRIRSYSQEQLTRYVAYICGVHDA